MSYQRHLLLMLIIAAFITLGALVVIQKNFFGEPVPLDTAMEQYSASCDSCHVPLQSLSPLSKVDPCDVCHESAAQKNQLIMPETMQSRYIGIAAQVINYMRTATAIQKSDPRYQNMVDSLWSAQQQIETMPAENQGEPILRLLARSEALVTQLSNEAHSGFLMSVKHDPLPTQAVISTVSYSLPTLQPIRLENFAIDLTPPERGKALEPFSVLVLSLCVLFMVLRRSPPGEDGVMSILLSAYSRRASLVASALSIFFVARSNHQTDIAAVLCKFYPDQS